MSTDDRTIDWYNKRASEYTKHVRDPDESVFHSLYEKPAMYKMLPDLSGKKVLSLGCGSGEDSHYLAQQGVAQSVGIDISAKLVEIATQSYQECSFSVMDMEKLGFNDNSFDFVYSSLAIHYIEDWTKVLNEVYRVLKPNSYFLFSCNHPLAFAMQTTTDNEKFKVEELSRRKNKKTEEVEIKGDYLSKKKIQPFEGFEITNYSKSIGDISAEIAKSGFVISEICEPKPLPKMKEVSPKDYETLTKIPGFIIFKLLKT